MVLKFKVVGKTDIGLVRAGNEDYLHLDKDHQVFAVCDGMGGHQAGEVASMTASQTLSTVFTSFKDELLSDPDMPFDVNLPKSGELLVKAIRLANREIHNRSSRDVNLTGMGTTVVGVALDEDIMSIAHVGDSRAYRFQERTLEPLTIDHSWVAEMQQKKMPGQEQELKGIGKNVITRALGVRENVEVDYRLIKVKPGDRFMLCSDGLCGFADDDEIFNVASRSADLEKMCDDLVQMANDRGGADNVTVICLEIIEIGESSVNEMKVMTFPAEDMDLLDVEDRWLDAMERSRQRQSGQGLEKPAGEESGASKVWLFTIFAVFIVVAVVVVYMSSMGE